MTTAIKVRHGYIVCLVLHYGSLQPIFHDDDGQMFFDTKKAAAASIKEAIDDVSDAINEGHMDEDARMTKGDYMVVPATFCDGFITARYDGNKYGMMQTDDDWVQIGCTNRL